MSRRETGRLVLLAVVGGTFLPDVTRELRQVRFQLGYNSNELGHRTNDTEAETPGDARPLGGPGEGR